MRRLLAAASAQACTRPHSPADDAPSPTCHRTAEGRRYCGADKVGCRTDNGERAQHIVIHGWHGLQRGKERPGKLSLPTASRT